MLGTWGDIERTIDQDGVTYGDGVRGYLLLSLAYDTHEMAVRHHEYRLT